MTAPAGPRAKWLDYLPALAFAVVLAGAFISGGGIISLTKDNARRIDQMEIEVRADAKARTEMLQALDLRLARIEVKLEMMVPAKEKSQ